MSPFFHQLNRMLKFGLGNYGSRGHSTVILPQFVSVVSSGRLSYRNDVFTPAKRIRSEAMANHELSLVQTSC